ncbi:fimbria/pilus periplasmic chaperone [Atlantibacter hermannii]|nr:fimbria/pilus periplasmic chaperone [Atlantibacter hermannii]NBC97806.1 fimbria/pilus periplasmic chaperone [Atlantibacter hermannii]
MLNKNILLLMTLALCIGRVDASVIVGGTRVIYPESEKEVTVKVNNTGSKGVLIQSWIDDGDANANPDSIKVPFVIKPPLNRIDAGKGQTLRITYMGGALARDRETLFWLNILEVPPVYKSESNKNNLQIAYRTRIKLLYRPTALQTDPGKAMTSLKWRMTSDGLEAKNDSPYFVNLSDIRIKKAGKYKIISADKVPPFGTAVFPLKGETINKGDALIYDYINDWGALNAVDFSL